MARYHIRMFELIMSNTELRFVVTMLLCLIAGLFTGAERESRGKDAGISTHMLVIVGSMLFTFVSSLIEGPYEVRIASQVVVGIGFLGGGLILKEGHSVRNLTTAASLWTAAAIGMAFGFGFFFIGIFTTFVAILLPRIPHFKFCESCGKKYTEQDNQKCSH